MKRFFCLLLTAVLCLGLLPCAAPASEEPVEEPVAEETASASGPEEPASEEPAAPEEPVQELPAPEELPEEPAAPEGPLPLDTDPLPMTDGAIQDVTVTGTYHQTEARSILAMINSFRTGSETWYWNETDTQKVWLSGLGTLGYDYALEKIAMQRAAEIAVYFEHTRPDGSSCFTCTADGVQSYGENIAMGQTSASEVFIGWREDNEPYDYQGHRRNMLREGYTAVGIACFEYNGTRYWVQEFGYERSSTGAAAANDSTTAVTVQQWVKDPTDPSALPEGSIGIDEAHFPDANFRTVLAEYYDPDGDGWFTPEEIAGFEALACYSAGIASLQGIEYFTALKYLDCSYNSLTWLDLTALAELNTLDCSWNDLTLLYTGLNPVLDWIDCSNNSLTSLDLTMNPEMRWLYCEGNPLEWVDVSQCPELCEMVLSYTPEYDETNDVDVYWVEDEETGGSVWGFSLNSGARILIISPIEAVKVLQQTVGLDTPGSYYTLPETSRILGGIVR